MPLKVNLNVMFDLETNQATYTDNSPYVANGYSPGDIQGFLKITYPDGITQDFLDLQSGVVNESNGFAFTTPLRIGADGEVMRGDYRFDYVSKASGVVLDTLVREIDFDYKQPELSVTPTVNLFEPMIYASDSTNYTVLYFNNTLSRIFSVIAPSISDDTFTATSDRIYFTGSNVYYNTSYVVKLDSVLVYTGKVSDPALYAVEFTNTWFSFRDRIVKEETFTINRGI